MSKLLTRRTVVLGTAAAAGIIGYEALPQGAFKYGLIKAADRFTLRAQRLLIGNALAREFSPADISRQFPTNGTAMPEGEAYQRLLASNFDDWALRIDGKVLKPFSASLADLKSMPARTQITMHACDEGWNAIGQWKGVPLGHLLNTAGLMPDARYVVFHCLDKQGDGNMYYESLDLFDAFHPQTILAYEMNGEPLPVGHGAPLRLRIELQIGYKNAKYIDRIEVVDRLGDIGKGRGGWWEDAGDAVWYAGQ
jgi:DMSO/TMAO reductase YedYZ molybdopterin-dependent catalytic subunit